MMRSGEDANSQTPARDERARTAMTKKTGMLGSILVAAMLLMTAPFAPAQTSWATLSAPPTGIAPPGDVLRPGHLGRQISNVELDTHFYHDLIGLELVGKREQPRPFFVNKGLQEVAALAQGVSDPYLQTSRVVLLPIPGTAAAQGGPEMTIEAIEIAGIPKRRFNPPLTDPGASYLKLYVADLDKTLAVLKGERTPVITEGGNPVELSGWPGIDGKIRAVMVRDPDGYPVELMQVTPAPTTTAAAGSNVLGARVTIVVDNLEKTARLYESLVGPDFKFWLSPWMGDAAYEKLTGTHSQFRMAQATVPGSPVVMELVEYKNHSKNFKRPWFQDAGAAHFLFMSKDDDVMMQRVKAAHLHSESKSDEPVFISKTVRTFFVGDPQGFWLEFMDHDVKTDPTGTYTR
jgi:catechol 2,3-dioxygenase-like lactoylglutathione lyase family enzyme